MGKTHCALLLAGLLAVVCAACADISAAPAPGATPFASATSLPPTTTPAPPTATPQPGPTPTAVLFAPPAERFLPALEDLGPDYQPDDSLISENLAMQAQLPVPKENIGAASFAYRGKHDLTGAQQGVYLSLTYWVITAPDEASAQLFYQMSRSDTYLKQAFLVVMPAAVQQTITQVASVPPVQSQCDDAAISTVISDPYGAYRRGEIAIPTLEPLIEKGFRGFSGEKLASLPPDLYLYAGCRVKNVLVMFWGYTQNNSDGKNTPIPDEVIAQQVGHYFDLVIGKMK